MITPRYATRPRASTCTPRGGADRFSSILDEGLGNLKSFLIKAYADQFSDGNDCAPSLTPRCVPVSTPNHTPRASSFESPPTIKTARSNNLEMPRIGADENSCVPAIDDCTASAATPLDRWARLFELVMQSQALAKHNKIYHMHECWSVYFRMLVHNEGNCQAGFEMAVQTLSSQQMQRRGSNASQYSLKESLRDIGHTLTPPEITSCVPVRRLWLVLVFIVICCDTFVLPINVCINSEDSEFINVFVLATSIFWAIDIIMNLVTGSYLHELVDLNGKWFGRKCIKSRMVFDVFLVVIDWTLLTISRILASQSLGSLGVMLRSIRAVRLIRLCRLLRLQRILRDAFAIGGKSSIALSGLLSAIFAYIIHVHFVACVWYAIGKADDRGWSYNCGRDGLNSMPVVGCYATALHWALTQIHGTTMLEYGATREKFVAVFAVFVGLLQFAFLLGKIVDATTKVMGVDRLDLKQQFVDLAKRHHLTSNVTRRMMWFVDASDAEVHLDRVIQQEDELMSILPLALRREALEQMRKPLLGISIITDLGHISSKILTQLCCDAISSHIIAASEFVFSAGDQAHHWRIIDTGALRYGEKGDDMWENVVGSLRDAKQITPSRPKNKMLGRFGTADSLLTRALSHECSNTTSLLTCLSSSFDRFAKKLTRKTSISEMVLWTPWVHTGDLFAVTDSLMLQLTMEEFHFVIKARMDACLLASRYAQQYVKHMTQVHTPITDLFEFTHEGYGDSCADYDVENSTQHFAFLSHFKEESGTEATLMQVGLQALITLDGFDLDATSVFLDSENLTDLSGLQEHVVNSKNLVLLLTPGVLQRPWCLLEIITASINEVQIVPVEIQRPGMMFTYPDDDFYDRLRKGGILSQKDIKLLSVEGISVVDVENALRQVFTQIALPFSPHRSKKVRDAELSEIMRRCAAREPRSPKSRHRTLS